VGRPFEVTRNVHGWKSIGLETTRVCTEKIKDMYVL